jgi:hypothetical protein
MSDGGKGSKPRPISVTQQEYDTRWDTIFGRDLNDDTNLDMPGTIGGAKLIFKDENESSGNNTNNRNQVSQ